MLHNYVLRRVTSRGKLKFVFHKRVSIFLFMSAVFFVFIGVLKRSAHSQTSQISSWQKRYSHLETCECTHPGSEKPGENGFTCSDEKLNAFCSLGITCSALKGELWKYRNIPCGHRVSCECEQPGNIHENSFRCSVEKYSSKCGKGEACLTPIGHVWQVDSPPCGSGRTAGIMLSKGAYDPLSLASACSRTMATVDPANAHHCKWYEDAQIVVPDCSRRESIVPRILHSIGAKGTPFTLSMVVAANPSYSVRRHNDSSAERFIRNSCGTDVAKAFSCLRAPSFRADLFRFCALFATGGVYLDEDIIPLKPLNTVISECSSATVGHDFPAGGYLAKQMKILAAAPGSELMKCSMDTIVDNVRRRRKPDSPLALTGPLLLQGCFERAPQNVAITYLDTRNAVWPYSGMRAGTDILAYEFPDSPKHFCHGMDCHDKRDYAALYAEGHVYQETCEL